MPQESRTNLDALESSLAALAEQMKSSHRTYARNLPTTEPNIYLHSLDCNLHTMVGARFKRDEVQVLQLKDETRVQYLSSAPELCFFVDVPKKKGKLRYLYLDCVLLQKEAATYGSVAEVVRALDLRRAGNEARQDSGSRPGTLASTRPPEPPLAIDEAKRIMTGIAAAIKGVRAKIEVPVGARTQLRMRADGDSAGAELDAHELHKALRLELGSDKELGVVRLLRATVDQQELDEFVAPMAKSWADSEQRGAANRWLLAAAGALGGDQTAAILGRFCAANRNDSKAHAALAAALDGLGQMGTLAAAHELYAVATLASRYTKRRNEARAILERVAGRAGVALDALIAQAVPRDPPAPDRARVIAVQSRRLERMMVDGKRLPFSRFRAEFLEHPLLLPLCERLVFAVFGPSGQDPGKSVLTHSFVPCGAKLLDAHGHELRIEPSALIGVAHAIELAATQLLTDWQTAWLAGKPAGGHAAGQPFLQLERPVFKLTEQQARANALYDFRNYRREWLHEQEWWGFKVDVDYMADVDTFAVMMERDSKYVEAKLDSQGLLFAIGMGKVELEYDLKRKQYVATPGDATLFGALHAVSQSELLYALIGPSPPKGVRAGAAPVRPLAPATSSSASRYPYAELAKSSRSQCLACEKPITKDTLRVVVEREIKTDAFSGLGAGYLHPDCARTYPGLDNLDDLLRKAGWNPSS